MQTHIYKKKRYNMPCTKRENITKMYNNVQHAMYWSAHFTQKCQKHHCKHIIKIVHTHTHTHTQQLIKREIKVYKAKPPQSKHGIVMWSNPCERKSDYIAIQGKKASPKWSSLLVSWEHQLHQLGSIASFLGDVLL